MTHLRQKSDATHIFDGLNEFPTHVAHMRLGSLVQEPITFSPTTEGCNITTLLYDLALQWLSDDRVHRKDLESQGRKVRGARRDQVRSIVHHSPVSDA